MKAPKVPSNILNKHWFLFQKTLRKLAIFSQFMDNSKNDLQTIRSDISSLKSSKADQIALKDQQKVYQLALRQLTSNLEDRIKSVEKMLNEMEKVQRSPKKQSQSKTEKLNSSNQAETKSASDTSSPKETEIPKSGTIIEQDLSRKNPD